MNGQQVLQILMSQLSVMASTIAWQATTGTAYEPKVERTHRVLFYLFRYHTNGHFRRRIYICRHQSWLCVNDSGRHLNFGNFNCFTSDTDYQRESIGARQVRRGPSLAQPSPTVIGLLFRKLLLLCIGCVCVCLCCISLAPRRPVYSLTE